MRKLDQALPYYPMFLNIRRKKCVVIGGGQVALRKVKVLLDHEASVKVISSDLCPKLIELSKQGQIQISHRNYRPGDLQKAFIAIAATDNSAVNRQVLKEAKDKAVLVNILDDPQNSDFTVPSCVRRGNMTIAISTAGKSPALARKIRTKLEKEFGEEYISLVNLVGEIRSEAKRQGTKISSDKWQKALNLDLMINLLKKGKVEKAKAALLSNLNIRQK